MGRWNVLRLRTRLALIGAGLAGLVTAGCNSAPPELPAPKTANLTAGRVLPKAATGSNPQAQQMEAFARQKAQEALSQAYQKK